MKKTYINPEIEVVELQMKQAMLAGSDLTAGGTEDNEDNLLGRDDFGLWN